MHSFEQFVALYMHNPDDKHPTRPGFEPSTSEFWATTGPNEPSGSCLCTTVHMSTRANTRFCSDVVLMLVDRLRHWPSIRTASGEHYVFDWTRVACTRHPQGVPAKTWHRHKCCCNVSPPSATWIITPMGQHLEFAGSAHQDTEIGVSLPRKHETVTQCWFNVGPPSTTSGQHWTNIGSMYRLCVNLLAM